MPWSAMRSVSSLDGCGWMAAVVVVVVVVVVVLRGSSASSGRIGLCFRGEDFILLALVALARRGDDE